MKEIIKSKNKLAKFIEDVFKGKVNRVFVDYSVSEQCTNDESYGCVCVKCGDCGRKFNKKGILIKEAKNGIK